MGHRRNQQKWGIDDRRMEVARLFSRRLKQTAIARELGVSNATITRDLRTIFQERQQQQQELLGQYLTQLIADTDEVIREAWEGWERSKQDEVRRKTVDSEKDGKKKEKTVTGQVGDPRFLAIVQKCLEYQGKLLGVEPPEKLDVTTTSISLTRIRQELVHDRESLVKIRKELIREANRHAAETDAEVECIGSDVVLDGDASVVCDGGEQG